jgi:predicted outer membrane repeat protein
VSSGRTNGPVAAIGSTDSLLQVATRRLHTGTLTVVDSAITDNSALSVGGIGNSGTVTLTNTSVTANRSLSSYGGGIYNDAIGDLTLDGTTTVAANTAQTNGGGIYNNGGTMTINPPAAVTGNTPDDCYGC